MNKKKILYVAGAVLVVIGVVFFDNIRCSSDYIESEISGSSMVGHFNPGDKVKVDTNYYSCRKKGPSRGDLVLISLDEEGKDVLVKEVFGLPGDKFEYVKNELNKYNFKLNGEIVHNIYDLPYELNEKRSAILRLIVRNTNTIIPQDEYLVFGTSRFGSRDSSRFGLVHISKIKGKVKSK